jgi:hypothetical protein
MGKSFRDLSDEILLILALYVRLALFRLITQRCSKIGDSLLAAGEIVVPTTRSTSSDLVGLSWGSLHFDVTKANWISGPIVMGLYTPRRALLRTGGRDSEDDNEVARIDLSCVLRAGGVSS